MRVRIIQSAILLLLVMIPYFSMGPSLSFTTMPVESNEFTTLDANEIRIRYYVRRYYVHDYAATGRTLELQILVEGSNDIDCVLMMCTPEGEPSYNVTMNETSTDNLYLTSLQFVLVLPENATIYPTYGTIVRYDVQYYVNTTTGVSITSENCPYQVKIGGLHGDGVPIGFYSTPDLWYEEGTTGHEVTWDVSTGSPSFYTLTEDGFLIDAWCWNGPLTINVDNLELGDYVYRLRATAGWTGATETVTVHVVTAIPFGVCTGSVGPINNLPQIIIGTVIGVCLIVIFIRVYRTKIKS
ncbi:MAG: hypothetical protein ACTSYJ_09330 [Candidatus Thorarchaeota archaeon]